MAALPTIRVTVAAPLDDLLGSLEEATALGDTAEVGPGLLLVVANGDTDPHTVTIATPGTMRGLAVADATVTVAAGDTGAIPLDSIFRGAQGRAAITYDAVTDLAVGVLKIGA